MKVSFTHIVPWSLKNLKQVYLSTIEDYMLSKIVHTLYALLKFEHPNAPVERQTAEHSLDQYCFFYVNKFIPIIANIMFVLPSDIIPRWQNNQTLSPSQSSVKSN
jgi:hypothetical protein